MARKRGRWGAQITERYGHKFRSKWEAERYEQLRMLEMAGEITNLNFRKVTKFKLCADYFCERTGKMVKAPTYQPDFEYDQDGEHIIEDAKGKTLPVNKVKRKIVESRHGVIIWFVYEDGRRE